MIYVGDKKATAYHGDTHPAELYGPAEIQTTGKNLLDVPGLLKSSPLIEASTGRIVIYPTSDKVDSYGSEFKFDENKTYVISGKVLGKFTGRIYSFWGESLFATNIGKDGKFSKIIYPKNIVDKKGFVLIRQNAESISYFSDEVVTIYDLQIEEGSVATSYEPYTGGKPGVYKYLTKYAGFENPVLSGTGRVDGWEAPYKAALKSVKVYGKGEQKTLTGSNLFDIYGGVDYPQYLDGEVLTVRSDTGNYMITSFAKKIACAPKEKLFLSCKKLNNAKGPRWLIRFFDDSGVNITTPIADWGYLDFYKGYYKDENSYSIEVPEKAMTAEISFVGITSNGEEFLKITEIKVSKTDVPYEPYCGGIPAPNPEYPIEPQFVENSEVLCRGRNLFDAISSEGNVTKKGLTFEVVDDGVHVYGTSTAEVYYNFKPLKWPLFDKDVILNGMVHPTAPYNGLVVNDVVLQKRSDEPFARMYMVFFGNQTIDKVYKPSVTFDEFVYEKHFDGGTAQLPILRALPDGSVRDEIDLRTGKITRRIKETVVDGTNTSFEYYGISEYDNSRNLFFIYADSLNSLRHGSPGVCNKYFWINTTLSKDYQARYNDTSGPGQRIYVSDPRFSTATEINEWAKKNPVIFWYADLNPIIEQVDPVILRQHPGYTQLIQQGGELDAEIEATVYKEEVI